MTAHLPPIRRKRGVGGLSPRTCYRRPAPLSVGMILLREVRDVADARSIEVCLMPLLRVGCVFHGLQYSSPHSCLLSANLGTSHIETLNVRLGELRHGEAPYAAVLLGDGSLP